MKHYSVQIVVIGVSKSLGRHWPFIDRVQPKTPCRGTGYSDLPSLSRVSQSTALSSRSLCSKDVEDILKQRHASMCKMTD